MNNKPKKISEIITENGAQTLLDGYTDFGTDAALTDDEQQRILQENYDRQIKVDERQVQSMGIK